MRFPLERMFGRSEHAFAHLKHVGRCEHAFRAYRKLTVSMFGLSEHALGVAPKACSMSARAGHVSARGWVAPLPNMLSVRRANACSDGENLLTVGSERMFEPPNMLQVCKRMFGPFEHAL